MQKPRRDRLMIIGLIAVPTVLAVAALIGALWYGGFFMQFAHS